MDDALAAEKSLAQLPSDGTPSDEDEKKIQAEKEHGSGLETPVEDEHAVEKLDSRLVKVKADADEALEHLPPNEREIIKRQLEVPDVKVTYLTLYRYATKMDLLVILISSLCAIGGGAAMPLMTVSILCERAIRKMATLTISRWSLVI